MATSSGPIARAIASNDPAGQRASLKWFTDTIRGQLDARGRAKSSARRISSAAFDVKKGMPVIGQMYFYFYDAKWKDELPYWDKFPLVIPVKFYKDGFLGLNLHYLPPSGRAILLDKLMEYKKAASSPRAFMKVSYALLKAAVASSLFEPCVHRYLTKHIMTDLVKVDDEYWERAARLPVQQFQKRSAASVWKDARKS